MSKILIGKRKTKQTIKTTHSRPSSKFPLRLHRQHDSHTISLRSGLGPDSGRPQAGLTRSTIARRITTLAFPSQQGEAQHKVQPSDLRDATATSLIYKYIHIHWNFTTTDIVFPFLFCSSQQVIRQAQWVDQCVRTEGRNGRRLVRITVIIADNNYPSDGDIKLLIDQSSEMLFLRGCVRDTIVKKMEPQLWDLDAICGIQISHLCIGTWENLRLPHSAYRRECDEEHENFAER